MSIANRLKKFSNARYSMLIIIILAVAVGYASTHAYATRVTQKKSNCVDSCVSIQKEGFSQSELAVKVGSYVEFRSADGRSHNLALGQGTEKDARVHESDQPTSHDHVGGTESGDFGADEAWRVQFKKAGTYIIHDHLHPELNILVVAY